MNDDVAQQGNKLLLDLASLEESINRTMSTLADQIQEAVSSGDQKKFLSILERMRSPLSH